MTRRAAYTRHQTWRSGASASCCTLQRSSIYCRGQAPYHRFQIRSILRKSGMKNTPPTAHTHECLEDSHQVTHYEEDTVGEVQMNKSIRVNCNAERKQVIKMLRHRKACFLLKMFDFEAA